MTSTDTEDLYQNRIAAFNELRNKYERREAEDIGGRPFILVSAMDSEMISRNGKDSSLLADLLRASYDRQSNIPQHKPGQLHAFLPVFYTLLDLQCGHLIHYFVERTPRLQLPIERDILDKMFPEEHFGNLSGDIYRQQWPWCALEFNSRMGSKIRHHEYIIPITARSKIQPTRDGVPKVDRKTTLWVVEIPMECLADELKQELEEADSDHKSGPEGISETHKSYKLVIKQFAEDHQSFEKEKNIFNFLRSRNVTGIVNYFGWYEHREKDANTDEIRTYHNLVLERGTQDLYSAFQKENPPITWVEIDAFWSSLFSVAHALASIQEIDDPDDMHMRYVWHGDIKPENILDVQGHFKLADPGEACVESGPKGENTKRGDKPLLRTQVPGGTKSFAAPEKNTYLTGPTKEIPRVTQGIDIWSLGCVYSVAATYVVSGKEGVKQYRLLRQTALSRLKLGIGDQFHNNSTVLPEVTMWHQYLRTCVRTQDDYTPRVLDIVDSTMLTTDENRVSGRDLTTKLKSIRDRARQIRGRQQPPEDILQFLDEVMASAGSGYSPTLEDLPRTISQSGADMFEEALLYRSLRSDGRQPLPRYPGTLQTARGLNTKIFPSQGNSERDKTLLAGTEAGICRPALSLERTVPRTEPSSVPYVPPITFWEVGAELEADIDQNPAKMSFGKVKNFVRRQPSNHKLMKSREDQLKKHFVNRDLIYLVDNASTMARFWDHATYLLRVMVWRSLGWDEDGMELVFTTGGPELGMNPRDKKGRLQRQKPDDFVKKMKNAQPRSDGEVNTNMKVSLESILSRHMRENSIGESLNKDLTILVLTDGLWGANDDTDVDDYLANFIKLNKATRGWDTKSGHGKTRQRPIGIQFVRFGHYPEAITRLQRLDDEIKNRVELSAKEIPDMIDTETADGDFYKMFLGSVQEDIDNRLTAGGHSTDMLSTQRYGSASSFDVDSPVFGSAQASGPSHTISRLPSRASSTYRDDRSRHAFSPVISAGERSTWHAPFGNNPGPRPGFQNSESYGEQHEQSPHHHLGRDEE